MLDRYKRDINYLRISVTDKCNLRCTYCMPEAGVPIKTHEDILSFEEIVAFTRYAASRGVNKVRITGGEPLVRKGIVSLVQMLSVIDGIDDLSLTTNAILLDRFAADLKMAGISRINISLDTLDPRRFMEITRGGELTSVLRGITAAVENGFDPIKINCVVNRSSDEKDAREVRKFAKENGFDVRFIHRMRLEQGEFSVVEGGAGGKCSICNRLRLTCDGKLLPCLFSEISYDIRKLGHDRAISLAIDKKPVSGDCNKTGYFYSIGG